jgi:hypothetical protein
MAMKYKMRNMHMVLIKPLFAMAVVFGFGTAFCGPSVNAFDNAGFEEHSKFQKETNGVEIAGGLGYNTSGGLRLYPARGKNGKLKYHFKTEFKPRAGKRYRFGFSYKLHGNVFAHCYWESYSDSRYV